MSGLRVVAALSGGVDSAVATARAVEAGHEVVGVHMALSLDPARGGGRGGGCCTPSDARDAARVADVLGIAFYVWDFAARFEQEVVGDFVSEYTAGRTPNPCVRCNQRIKFAALLDRAIGLGYDAVCTGHYARLRHDEHAAPQLHRAADAAKDQSYVLAILSPEQLARSIFPLGHSRKSQVRAEAARRGLLVDNKPDSHDICFIPDGDTAAWLRDRIGPRQGDIVDAQNGAVLGTHRGAESFTVGQRRGLGLRVPSVDGSPRYAVATDPRTQTVFVGPAQMLDVEHIRVDAVVWNGPIGRAEVDGSPFDCSVQVRAHGAAVPATVEVSPLADGNRAAVVHLRDPIRGVAPGQLLVMYDGTMVLGSATINAGSGAVLATRGH